MTLDQDVDPATFFHKGQKITAKVIALGETGKHIELSRRETLPNPWPEFARRYREDDVVHGVVRALRPDGVFVRVEAGVNGFVPCDELATWQISKPEELLWGGDEVEAVITHLDARNERLALSIKARMQQRAQATQMIERLAEKMVEHATSAPISPIGELPRVTENERERIGQIIVIDDDDSIRNGMVEWLQQRGYRAIAAKTIPEVLGQVRVEEKGLLFVDIHLSDGDGLELVRDLRADGGDILVCVMSNPEWLLERTDEIRAAKVSQVFEKPLNRDDIDQFLYRLARGEPVQPAWKMPLADQDGKTGQQSLNITLGNFPPHRRLQSALEKLVEMAHAEKGIVFVKDPISETISIAAEAGTLPLRQETFYEVWESPVKDVITENEPVFEGRAKENKRFEKLLHLLSFESCIGAPIEVMGEVRHALFFFHRKPNAAAQVRRQYIELDSLWLAAILEEQAIHERLRKLSPLLLSGELAVALAHEVYNKVDGLELQLSNLLSPAHPPADIRTPLSDLQNSVIDLKTLVSSFQQMMKAKETATTFDVNDVVRRALLLVRPLARKEGVKIAVRLADNLPQVKGNVIALQQVFFNIMLNAVQHMALKTDKQRLLEISTSYEPDHRKHPIMIRFADTGSGIHKQLWERIFDLGFSTRGGSGLGLFIARSLIETLGGKIEVEESIVPLSATFLVKLAA